MIRLTKSAFLEVRLEIGVQDAAMIREKLLSILSGKSAVQENCIYDKGIFKGDECFSDGVVLIRCSENEVLSKQKDGLVLDLDTDSIDLLAALLDKVIRREKYVPEVCELSVQGKKKEVTLILAAHQ